MTVFMFHVHLPWMPLDFIAAGRRVRLFGCLLAAIYIGVLQPFSAAFLANYSRCSQPHYFARRLCFRIVDQYPVTITRFKFTTYSTKWFAPYGHFYAIQPLDNFQFYVLGDKSVKGGFKSHHPFRYNSPCFVFGVHVNPFV